MQVRDDGISEVEGTLCLYLEELELAYPVCIYMCFFPFIYTLNSCSHPYVGTS